MNDTPTQDKMRYGQVVEVEAKLSRLYHDRYGRELPDDTPVAAAVGYKKQPSMVDHVRAMVARELSEHAAAQGAESFEEANDFEVGDDYEPESPYEALGSDLGPLPPEVANWSAAERAAYRDQKLREAQAEHLSKSPPAAAGGGGALTNRGSTHPEHHVADRPGLYAGHAPG